MKRGLKIGVAAAVLLAVAASVFWLSPLQYFGLPHQFVLRQPLLCQVKRRYLKMQLSTD